MGKSFGGTPAVRECSLAVGRGEIVALLGPSGCGKSTLLNMIAGFETADSGEIRLGGKPLDGVPSYRRNVAMVFQNYALFPHLTVDANVGYGLRARGRPTKAVDAQVRAMIELLKLDGLGARYPSQLSGGQKQRVAIARALAIEPAVLLLDEAFSALDRNLREEMQLELSLLLRRMRVTTILVTHDQREAFSLADRMAVMHGGRIIQVGSPRQMYEAPADDLVLRFLSSANRLAVDVEEQGETGAKARIAPDAEFDLHGRRADGTRRGYLHLRTTDVSVSDTPTRVHDGTPAIVTLTTFLGAQERIVLLLGGQQIVIDRPTGGRQAVPVDVGCRVYVDFDPQKCRLTATG